MTTCVAWSGIFFPICPALITDESVRTVIITASITMRRMIRVNIFCSACATMSVAFKEIPWYSTQTCCVVIVWLDNLELHAQVPAQVPHSAGQRHPEAPLQHFQDLRLPRDWIRGCNRVSERQGESLFTLGRLLKYGCYTLHNKCPTCAPSPPSPNT